MKTYTDQELLQMLSASEEDRKEEALKYLYRSMFKMIQHYIQTNNGGPSDVDDVFQDAIIVLYHQVRKPSFLLTSSISTYFYSVCRNLWLKKLRRQSRQAEWGRGIGKYPHRRKPVGGFGGAGACQKCG